MSSFKQWYKNQLRRSRLLKGSFCGLTVIVADVDSANIDIMIKQAVLSLETAYVQACYALLATSEDHFPVSWLRVEVLKIEKFCPPKGLFWIFKCMQGWKDSTINREMCLLILPQICWQSDMAQ